MAKKNQKNSVDGTNNEGTSQMDNENSTNEDNATNSEGTPKKGKRGRVAGQVAANKLFAVVARESGMETIPFVSKQGLTAWAKENLAGGEESLANDQKYMTSGELVIIVWGHVIKAEMKSVTKMVF